MNKASYSRKQSIFGRDLYGRRHVDVLFLCVIIINISRP